MKSRLVIIFLSIFPYLLCEGAEDSQNIIVKEFVIYPNKSPNDNLSFPTKIKKDSVFSQEDFDQDLKELAKKYDKINPKLKISNHKAFIKIEVWEKPIINNIIISGNNNIKTRKILKKLKIKEREIFERESFLTAFSELKTLYLRKGFFNAKLSYKITENDDSSVDILITINEGFSRKINKIVVFGVNKKEQETITSLISTKKYIPLINLINPCGLYHPEIVEQDTFIIINHFQNQGFADVEVNTSIKDDIEGCISLCIDVKKGSRYRIGSISIENNNNYNTSSLLKTLPFHSGDIYSPDLLSKGVHKIKEVYNKLGYMNAAVDMQLNLQEHVNKYDVKLLVHEGSCYKIGLIQIFGNTTTQNKIILNESYSICPGETLNTKKLEETEKKLRQTGYFKSVNVYTTRSQIDPTDISSEYRDIQIEVAETSTGNLGLFMGFSSLDRLFGGIEVSENNFNLGGVTNLLNKGPRALRGGGELLHLKLNVGEKINEYSLQWTKPFVFNTPCLLGIDLEKSNNKTFSSNYEINTTGGNVNVTYVYSPVFKYGVYYRGNHTKLILKKDDSPLSPIEGDNRGFISASGIVTNFDTIDNPRAPKNGIRGKFNIELAGLGGKFKFWKAAYFISSYRQLTEKGVAKLRGEIQFIQTYGGMQPSQVPLGERFFLGGETTIRGYKPFIVGPKFSPTEPKGGLSYVLISEEFQHNLVCRPNINAFVFLDSGYLSEKEFTLKKEFVASVGCGLRFDIMQNIPIMLGLGWPIKPTEIFQGQKINNSQRFFFALGGLF